MAILAVVGRTTRDVVDSSPPRPGGVPFHAASALRFVGEEAILVTRCAADDRSMLLAPLEAFGLPVVWEEEPQSAAFRLDYDRGRRLLTIESLCNPWDGIELRSRLRRAVGDADWVHVGALWRDEFSPELLAELARGRRLSLDGHALVRPARPGPISPDAAFDPATLADVDLLHLSEDEVDVLGLTLDAASLQTLGVPEIIVTLGERGSIVVADDLFATVPSRAIAGVDPTGAGDAFTAAYVAARRGGEGPEPSARRATEVVRELLLRRSST